MRGKSGSVLTADEVVSLELHAGPTWQSHVNEGDTLPGEAPVDRDIQAWKGYQKSLAKSILFWLGGVASGGVIFLVSKWSIKAWIWFTLVPSDLGIADYVLIVESDGPVACLPVEEEGQSTPSRRDRGGVSTGEESAAQPFISADQQPRVVTYKCLRYVYSSRHSIFVLPPPVPPTFQQELSDAHEAAYQDNATNKQVHDRVLTRDSQASSARLLLYGPNELSVPVRSFGELLWDETFHPFYVFQYLSALVWCWENYYFFALFVLFSTAASVFFSVENAHANRVRLAHLARFSCEVLVPGPGGTTRSLHSSQLVPGDLVWVRAGVLPADVVLLLGECIADEAMLTGEAVPVRKSPYSPHAGGPPYDPWEDKACTLYGGTSIAQVRPAGIDPGALGMVARTGFFTAKGELLRLMFPKDDRTGFATDALAFIGLMLMLGIAGYAWSVSSLLAQGTPIGWIILQALDMVTICVPPSLPLCLSASIAIAISRLRTQDIFVSEPGKVVTAGHLDVACFDKTGTLTEAGLDLQGVLPAVRVSGQMCFGALEEHVSLCARDVAELLASCHSVADINGQLVGDPLEIKLLQATGWVFRDYHASGSAATSCVYPLGTPWAGGVDILQRFDFTAESARCTVVVCPSGGGPARTHVKGSPEVVRQLVDPATVPDDFDAVLEGLAREGFRVIALASSGPREASWERGTSRDNAEMGLSFQGFAVMVNALRPDSQGTISALQEVNIRTIMVTGDHVRTAISVAHSCGILPSGLPVCIFDAEVGEGGTQQLQVRLTQPDGEAQLIAINTAIPALLQGEMACAVTGRGFTELVGLTNGALLDVALSHGAVWARMAPEQKRSLVEALDGRRGVMGLARAPAGPRHVAFCGDGANDVGALKAAAVGVSLCDAEASVAAPLTSRRPSIACMLAVICEGRASLEAAYAIFSFIIAYAFIQLMSANILYSYGLNQSMWQYLLQDMGIVMVLGFLMGYTPSTARLLPSRPPRRVVTAPVLLPVAAQMAVAALFQAAAMGVLRLQPWYTRYKMPDIRLRNFREWDAPENVVVTLMGFAQLLVAAAVFNRGSLHRQPFWQNPALATALLLQVSLLWYLVMSPGSGLTLLLRGTTQLPASFRQQFAALILCYASAAVLVDLAMAALMSGFRRPLTPGLLARPHSITGLSRRRS